MSVKGFIDRMMQSVEQYRIVQLARSYAFVDRDERKARLRLIMALSVELEKIRAVSVFSTGLGEGVIEDIIEGDWEAAHRLTQGFRFEDKGWEDCRERYAPLWRRFVELVEVEYLLAQKRAQAPVGSDPQPD